MRFGIRAVLLSAGFCLLLPAQTEFQAGVASVDITPRESVWMAGFASRKKPSESVEAPLHAKALALRDRSGQLFVIVSADLIGFRRALSDVIAERCLSRYGLARDRLLLNASHVHSGPELGLGGGNVPPERVKRQQVTVKYTRELLDRVVELVGKSIENLAPARLEFGQGLAGFAVNRRRSRPNTRQLPGPVDHDVPVLAVRAPDGGMRAILFGYACHPTTNAAYFITADYPGYAQAELEKMYPGAVALFVQGCGADSNPLPRFHSDDPALVRRSLELSKLYGKVLSEAVDLTLRGKLAPLTGPVRTVFEYVEIPYETQPSREELEQRRTSKEPERRSQAERLLKALDSGSKPPERQPYAIQIVRFGGMKIIALAGEVVVDYALRLKAAYGWEDTWMAAYSNDIPGYIPSRRVLSEGGYETGGGAGGAYSTAVEEIIVEKVDALMRRVGP
ncbi:MAG: neutral/alkaline non-lysosomal ceramidase N-terminal domain-containing protein [Bryobacterales bacterium]|nr:neutral/alkaline non-lysosomal ceramidase N-terminal domain-containing protein [Bryobacterales bacterium]